MRARNIKPGYFKNEDLAECPFEARLLFAGLWCLADRSGRMEYRPKRIKAEIFPFDSVDVPSMVQALCKYGFARIYVVDGVTYLDLPTFTRNQTPHKNEKPSTLPPYEARDGAQDNAANQGETRDSRTSTVQAHDEHGTSTSALVLTPDSLKPDILTADCLTADVPKGGAGLPPLPPAASPSTAVSIREQPPPPSVISLPTNIVGEEYAITKAQVAEFAALYPAVDVEQQLRAMKGWLIANPKNRKTRDGMLRFVNNWLSKEQNNPKPKSQRHQNATNSRNYCPDEDTNAARLRALGVT